MFVKIAKSLDQWERFSSMDTLPKNILYVQIHAVYERVAKDQRAVLEEPTDLCPWAIAGSAHGEGRIRLCVIDPEKVFGGGTYKTIAVAYQLIIRPSGKIVAKWMAAAEPTTKYGSPLYLRECHALHRVVWDQLGGDAAQILTHPGRMLEFAIPRCLQPVYRCDLMDFTFRRKLTMPDVYMVADRVFSALKALHERRVVHRDVSPTNWLIDNKGALLLHDFDLTALGTVIGSSRVKGYYYWDLASCSGFTTPACDIVGGALTVFWAMYSEASVSEWRNHQQFRKSPEILWKELAPARPDYNADQPKCLKLTRLICDIVSKEKEWARQLIEGLICHFAELDSGDLRKRLTSRVGQFIVDARFCYGRDVWMMERIRPYRKRCLSILDKKEEARPSVAVWLADMKQVIRSGAFEEMLSFSVLDKRDLGVIGHQWCTLTEMSKAFIVTEWGGAHGWPDNPLPREVMASLLSFNERDRERGWQMCGRYFPTATEILARLDEMLDA